MLTFKLSRRGKKKQPTYRLVVVDKKKDPWGATKEDVGSYNPHTKKAQFKIERIKFWLSKGAQPSLTVHNLFVKEKILNTSKKKIKIKIKKKSAPTNSTNQQQTTTHEAPPKLEKEKKEETVKKESAENETKIEKEKVIENNQKKEEETEEPKEKQQEEKPAEK